VLRISLAGPGGTDGRPALLGQLPEPIDALGAEHVGVSGDGVDEDVQVPVDLPGEERACQLDRRRRRGETCVVMQSLEVDDDVSDVAVRVVRSLHHLDEQIKGDLRQRDDCRRLTCSE